MIPGRIADANTVLGEPEGWDAKRDGAVSRLHIHAEQVGNHIRMSSAWFPTIGELQRLLAGSPVYLSILGPRHPPLWLTVGEPADAINPIPRAAKVVRSNAVPAVVHVCFDSAPTDEQITAIETALK